MNDTLGIVGFGMVGKAVAHGFPMIPKYISDPAYNTTTIKDVCDINPEAIFVCVPTPTDDTNYSVLRNTLKSINDYGYTGLTIVKSTVLPKYVEEFDIVLNPEFLSRATSNDDFVNPHLLVLGGSRADEALELYNKYSIVNAEHVVVTDISTAAMIKYTLNSFYATKVTFMNEMYEVANRIGADYNQLTSALKLHPWAGSHHFDVPGPDGQRGFGGPCLPKDTQALVKEFDVEILKTVLELNSKYRDK